MTAATVATGPSVVANTDDIRSLTTLLLAATDDARKAADSVHHGLGLGDLALAGGLDPVGAVNFETAAARVLLGPFGLAGIEADLQQLASAVRHAAESYVEADLLAQAEVLAGPAISALTLLASVVPPDSTPTVTALGPTGPQTGPPRNLSDLMSKLAQLDSTRQAGRGEIDIQTLTGFDANGNPVRKVIAYLPGVDSWNPLGVRSDVNNGFAAARPVDGRSSTYDYGVLAALRAAGVRPTDDVTLVGESQGGAVAVDTAVMRSIQANSASRTSSPPERRPASPC